MKLYDKKLLVSPAFISNWRDIHRSIPGWAKKFVNDKIKEYEHCVENESYDEKDSDLHIEHWIPASLNNKVSRYWEDICPRIVIEEQLHCCIRNYWDQDHHAKAYTSPDWVNGVIMSFFWRPLLVTAVFSHGYSFLAASSIASTIL